MIEERNDVRKKRSGVIEKKGFMNEEGSDVKKKGARGEGK